LKKKQAKSIWVSYYDLSATVVLLTGVQRAAPEVYATCPPASSTLKKPGQLEKWQVDQYFDKGFMVIPKFFTQEEMAPVIDVRCFVKK